MRTIMTALVALLVACTPTNVDSAATAHCRLDTPEAIIEAYMLMELPASTRDIEIIDCTGFFDSSSLYASFLIDPADLDEFQAATAVDVWNTEANPPETFRTSVDLRELPLDSFESYIWGETTRMRRPSVVIDTSDPEVYKVYVDASSQS